MDDSLTKTTKINIVSPIKIRKKDKSKELEQSPTKSPSRKNPLIHQGTMQNKNFKKIKKMMEVTKTCILIPQEIFRDDCIKEIWKKIGSLEEFKRIFELNHSSMKSNINVTLNKNISEKS